MLCNIACSIAFVRLRAPVVSCEHEEATYMECKINVRERKEVRFVDVHVRLCSRSRHTGSYAQRPTSAGMLGAVDGATPFLIAVVFASEGTLLNKYKCCQVLPPTERRIATTA